MLIALTGLLCAQYYGCVHKLDPVDPGYDPAIRKLPEISLPDFGSVFTNAWLSISVINQTILLASRISFWLEWQLPVVRKANQSFLQIIFLLQHFLIMFSYNDHINAVISQSYREN